MNVTFFGQFLLDQGLITQEQLDSATAFQKGNNTLLGALALQYGFLTREQVVSILREQRESYVKFGEVALKKKWLTEAQVRELLTLQGQNHVYLGEALTRRHYLSVKEVNKQLNMFHKEIQQQNVCLTSVLNSQDDSQVLLCAYEMTCEYLYRLGYAVRILDVTSVLPEQESENSLVMSLICGETTYYFGWYFPDVLGDQIISGKQSGTVCYSPKEGHKELERMFYNLNLILCEEMGRKGLDIKIGAPLAHVPENVGTWTTLHAETLVGTFYVLLGCEEVNCSPSC
jgi:hypothetical protein